MGVFGKITAKSRVTVLPALGSDRSEDCAYSPIGDGGCFGGLLSSAATIDKSDNSREGGHASSSQYRRCHCRIVCCHQHSWFADSMPPDIAEKIAALGRVIAVPQTDAIYAPLHPTDPYPGVNVTRDVRYGPADLNVLDVFTAENAAGGRDQYWFSYTVAGFRSAPRKPPALRSWTISRYGRPTTAWWASTLIIGWRPSRLGQAVPRTWQRSCAGSRRTSQVTEAIHRASI